jgi:hypothetical protein
MALRRVAATRLEVEADFDHHPDNDAPGIIWNDPGQECVGVWGSLSTNRFGHGSEKVSLDLRAGSTAYLSAEPQMGIVTAGQITLIQVTENQGRTDVANLHQTSSVCGKA